MTFEDHLDGPGMALNERNTSGSLYGVDISHLALGDWRECVLESQGHLNSLSDVSFEFKNSSYILCFLSIFLGTFQIYLWSN